jgi:hypothetical protein
MERALFTQLLEQGVKPALAVFIDGLNDFTVDEPMYSRRLREFMDGRTGAPAPRLRDRLPAVRLASAGLRRVVRAGRVAPPADSTADSDDGRRSSADTAIEPVLARYLANVRMARATAQAFGVQTLFVWQPIPSYHYDIRNHLFATHSGWLRNTGERARVGYDELARRFAATPPGDEFLWLADMQQDMAENLYVDQVHYTGAMSERIAQRIAAAIADRQLLR